MSKTPGRTYKYYTGEPLFAFGHGLSCAHHAYATTFSRLARTVRVCDMVLLCVCLAAVGELVCLWGAGQSGVLVGFGCLGALGGLVCLRGTGESSSELSERLMGYHCTDDVDILGCTRGS